MGIYIRESCILLTKESVLQRECSAVRGGDYSAGLCRLSMRLHGIGFSVTVSSWEEDWMRHVMIALALLVWGGNAKAHPIDESKVIDLTYSFDEHTIYWPTAKPFQLEIVSSAKTAGGFWYAANNICLAEHGGTHMDAPIHFAEGKRAADEVPVQQLIGPAVIVDVRTQAAADADYRLTVEDLTTWEKKHGRIPKGALVVMFSGWGAR